MQLLGKPASKMKLVRQFFSFGLVGVAATLSHVGVAWLLIEYFAVNAYLANAFGACVAVIVSFLGNANFTVSADQRWLVYVQTDQRINDLALLENIH